MISLHYPIKCSLYVSFRSTVQQIPRSLQISARSSLPPLNRCINLGSRLVLMKIALARNTSNQQ